jgi:hypothetical protein
MAIGAAVAAVAIGCSLAGVVSGALDKDDDDEKKEESK